VSKLSEAVSMPVSGNRPLNAPAPLTRRALFTVLPSGAFGCIGCARAFAGAQTSPHTSTEQAGLTWNEIFRFAYRKDLIPVLKELAAQVGRDKFCSMLRQASDDIVRRKTAGRPPSIPSVAALAAAMQNPPALIRHALDAEIVEQSPAAFEYRVKACLWAKTFREEDAGDIGYAMVCYPDYAVAKGLNPKLRLIREKTLMQGHDSCTLRYVMET
jgi:hypothetical protein